MNSNSLKNTTLLLLSFLYFIFPVIPVTAQSEELTPDKQEIYQLIEQYNQVRENKDVINLEKILTTNVDQLVSSGEWRRGIESAVEGMLRSSNRNPGQRTITVEEIRLLDVNVALVDTRYEIRLDNGTIRNLWSTFIVIRQDSQWKITAIRNMSPTQQP